MTHRVQRQRALTNRSFIGLGNKIVFGFSCSRVALDDSLFLLRQRYLSRQLVFGGFQYVWEAGRPEGFCPRAATELSEQSNARFASADLLCFFIDLRSDWIYGASQPPSIFLLPVYSPSGWL
jgi:hypothetical protein